MCNFCGGSLSVSLAIAQCFLKSYLTYVHCKVDVRIVSREYSLLSALLGGLQQQLLTLFFFFFFLRFGPGASPLLHLYSFSFFIFILLWKPFVFTLLFVWRGTTGVCIHGQRCAVQ